VLNLAPFPARDLNAILYRTERAMLDPAGLPGRDWYRHQFYAPGLYTGYDVKTLPGVREAIETKQWALARRQLEAVKKAIASVAQEVERAAAILRQPPL
jgi:N-acetylated-alpha-linked acidic dipeptidase